MAARTFTKHIFETEYPKIVNDNEKVNSDSGTYYAILPKFRQTFEHYLSVGGNLVGCDGGFGLDLFYTRFFAEETKRVVKMLRNQEIFDRPEENPLHESIMNAISRQN